MKHISLTLMRIAVCGLAVISIGQVVIAADDEVSPTPDELACHFASDCVHARNACGPSYGIYINSRSHKAFEKRVFQACSNKSGTKRELTKKYTYALCTEKKCTTNFSDSPSVCEEISDPVSKQKCLTFWAAPTLTPKRPK